MNFSHISDPRCRGKSDGTVRRAALNKILAAQQYQCPLCGDDISETATIDHIIPLSRMGAHTICNIQLLCMACNNWKSSILPSWVSQNRTHIDEQPRVPRIETDPYIIELMEPKGWRR